MRYKDKIFGAFEEDREYSSLAEEKGPQRSDVVFRDPFEFYRIPVNESQYIPRSQKGLLMAFLEGLVSIQSFIEMATSLRPLADEAQDLDEITRLISQQKLANRPNPHSVKILREMIKDPNPEIALYAAEGINSIEGTFNKKIDAVKDRMDGEEGEPFDNYFEIGTLYYKYARLMEGQDLIQDFYLGESLGFLLKAHRLRKYDFNVIRNLGEVLIILKKYNYAINIYIYLTSKLRTDVASMLKLAECYYSIGEFNKVIGVCWRIAKYADESPEYNEDIERVVYQWLI